MAGTANTRQSSSEVPYCYDDMCTGIVGQHLCTTFTSSANTFLLSDLGKHKTEQMATIPQWIYFGCLRFLIHTAGWKGWRRHESPVRWNCLSNVRSHNVQSNGGFDTKRSKAALRLVDRSLTFTSTFENLL